MPTDREDKLLTTDWGPGGLDEDPDQMAIEDNLERGLVEVDGEWIDPEEDPEGAELAKGAAHDVSGEARDEKGRWIAASESQKGDVIRFTPRSGKSRVTVHVDQPYDGVAIMGRRAKMENGSVVTRGESHAHLVPGEVELVHRNPPAGPSRLEKAEGDMTGPMAWKRHEQGYLSSDGSFYLERGAPMSGGGTAWLIWRKAQPGELEHTDQGTWDHHGNYARTQDEMMGRDYAEPKDAAARAARDDWYLHINDAGTLAEAKDTAEFRRRSH